MLKVLEEKPLELFQDEELQAIVESDVVLAYELHAYEGSNKHGLQVTCIDWNCGGQSIAVSYGRFDLQGWSSVPGLLAIWQMASLTSSSHLTPQHKLETDSALICCAFHPTHPGLICGGGYDGRVYVWDLGCESGSELVGCSESSDPGHHNSIVCVCWQLQNLRSGEKRYRIVSVGIDGQVFVWNPAHPRKPVLGFMLKDATASLNAPSYCPISAAFTQGGELTDTFVVGTPVGQIFRCSLNYDAMAEKEFQEQVKNGVSSPELGPIIRLGKEDKQRKDSGATLSYHSNFQLIPGGANSLGISPYCGEVFLVAGRNGSVRIHSQEIVEPLSTVVPSASQLINVKWSPTKPLVFAVASDDGMVYFYDLSTVQRLDDNIEPVFALDVTNGNNFPVNNVSFNCGDYFASSYSDFVRVWNLGYSFCCSQQSELHRLQQLVGSNQWLQKESAKAFD